MYSGSLNVFKHYTAESPNESLSSLLLQLYLFVYITYRCRVPTPYLHTEHRDAQCMYCTLHTIVSIMHKPCRDLGILILWQISRNRYSEATSKLDYPALLEFLAMG